MAQTTERLNSSTICMVSGLPIHFVTMEQHGLYPKIPDPYSCWLILWNQTRPSRMRKIAFWLLATVVCTDTQFYTTEQRMYSLYLHIQSKLKSKTCLSLISSSQHLHNLFHLQIHCTRKATSSRLKGPSDRCWPAVNMQEMSDTGHEDDSLLVKYLARFNGKVALVLK